MSFFDTTPLGRILNRFSKDMDEGEGLPSLSQFTNRFTTRMLYVRVLLSHMPPFHFFATVDVRLALQSEVLLQNLALVLFCLGVVGTVFPWFVFSIIPLGVFLFVVNRISRFVLYGFIQSSDW